MLTNQAISSVDLKPITWEFNERFENGWMTGPKQMLAELSGLNEADIGLITFPDADRVMQEFMLHLPDSIRAAIVNGSIPVAHGAPPVHNQADEAIAPVHDGFGEDAGPDMDI